MNFIIGGAIIGMSVSLMLLFNGRVTGISGIIGGLLNSANKDRAWRIMFLLGLLFGGFYLKLFHPQSFDFHLNARSIDFIMAGILVGAGTLMGNGCTSGHGVCGISRFSLRSIMATTVFIIFGMISVILFKIVRGQL